MNDQISTKNGKQGGLTRSAIETGRQLVEDWEKAQPDNFFSADIGFQRTLEYHWGLDQYRINVPRLYSFGGQLAQTVDALVREANQDETLPRLNRFNGRGDRVEEVIFHPSHLEVGRLIYRSEIMSAYKNPGNNTFSLALFYLSSQNGEAGHNCPLACTAGLIKALQAVGSQELQDRYLPRLLDPNYESLIHGAQFLTEVQGGSDVGANATTATLANSASGTWLLNGEKWFCSNITAELALVTARVAGQGDGTRGLGLFLLPRYLAEGQLNNVYIRRLKEKLGTRSMATGELEFVNAVAYQVGPVEQGFKNVMEYVINTSRIYNAAAVAGNARRAFLTAKTFAEHRTAFGQPIIHFPIVQDMLANMKADVAAMVSGTMRIVKVLDEIELGEQEVEANHFLRMAVNLNKYRSSILAREVILSAIELLGGNGTVETFSVLPRLLRDNVVYENWEGTHNVLLAQVQRDIRRYNFHHAFVKTIDSLLISLDDELFQRESSELLKRFVAEIEEVLKMDEITAAIFFRPLMDRLTDLYYSACLAAEGKWEMEDKKERNKSRQAGLFFNRRVARREPKDIPYYDDLVSRLC